MERLRILAAASALGEFTAAQLAAYSGANENTVRSTLRREPRLFEVVPGETAANVAGRPPKRYRVVDVESIRAEAHALEQSLAPLAGQAPDEPRGAAESEQDRLDAIVVAEDAVIRSWDAADPDEKRVLAEVALESVAQARAAGTEVAGGDALDRRAAGVEAFAQLARAQARSEPLRVGMLKRASSGLSNLAEVAPDRVPRFLLGLGEAAITAGELPPVALVTGTHATPSDAIPQLADTAWIKRSLLRNRGTVWAQRWAEPLLKWHLFTGLVVYDPGTKQLEESLESLKDWQLPTVVVSGRKSMRAVGKVAEAGAYFVPSSNGVSGLSATLRSAASQRTSGVRTVAGRAR